MSSTAPQPSSTTVSRKSENGGTLPSLTGLRWVAAFLVFGFHLCLVEYFKPGPEARMITAVFRPGSVGVSFFFILSGFVLMWACPSTGFRKFWWRRFARVYPLHIATAILVAILLLTYKPWELPSPWVAVANVFLVQAWSPELDYLQSLNTVSWTLSVEAFFYLTFPLLALGVTRLNRRGVVATGAGALAATTLGPAAGLLFAGREQVDWFFHWTPVGRLPEFVLGITLALLVRSWRPQRLLPLWCAAGALTVGGYFLSIHVPEPWGYAACTMPGFALLLFTAAVADLSKRWTPWRNRTMVRLGEWSFAFYLVHLLVVRLFEATIGYHPKFPPGKGAALTVATFLLSLGAAWLLHAAVERPARGVLLNRRRRMRKLRPS
ncbi:acyltransferase family protein [Actinoplanes lutulentus]|nr:acyltransferase [Actinoplanes lutulentus]